MPLERVLVFGASGQVGRALLHELGAKSIGITHAQVDFTQPETFLRVLDQHRPDAVINAAAYTQVDKAESEQALAYAVNAEAPGAIAYWCSDHNVPLVHYSTDYVFDGNGDEAWVESDATHPLNVYGASKREGERAIERAGGAYFIFRTSWLYDAVGKNFFNTMLAKAKSGQNVKVVADQFGAPTYTPHLAHATFQALEAAIRKPVFPSGIYHLCNVGETTWHGFATAIFDAVPVDSGTGLVQPVTSDEYIVAAKRPKNSRLDCTKAQIILGVSLPNWRDGLSECMAATQ